MANNLLPPICRALTNIWRAMVKASAAVWQAFCLWLFGAAIGVMAALNEQVGATTTLIAALFVFVGGSLSALYRPPNLDADSRKWIVQAMGLVSLGLLIGLLGGFQLRFHDQANLQLEIVRRRARLDRELGSHGQRLADYWGGGDSRIALAAGDPPIQGPHASVTLRTDALGSDLQHALRELNRVIGDIQMANSDDPRLVDLRIHRSVLDNPEQYANEVYLWHVEQTAELVEHDAVAKDSLIELAARCRESAGQRSP